jgi:hypothetical protein
MVNSYENRLKNDKNKNPAPRLSFLNEKYKYLIDFGETKVILKYYFDKKI